MTRLRPASRDATARGKIVDTLRAKKPVIGACVWDCISAGIVEKAGFEYAEVSGYQVAASAIGKLDIGLTTMTEMTTQSRNIAHSIGIPVVTDAEQGYGNAIHMIRTIQEMESAGVQGVMIDDKVMETCPYLPSVAIKERYWSGVIPEDELVGKVSAAVAARESDDFVIKFRSNARGPGLRGPLEPAVRRCKLALKAGADIVHANAKDEKELEIWNGIGAPLDIILSYEWPFMKGKTFYEIGQMASNIKWINIGTPAVRYVAKTLLRALKQVRESGVNDALRSDEMSQADWMDLFDVKELEAQIENFIPARKA